MSNDYLFENALRLARKHNPNFQPGKIIPQIRPTTQKLGFKDAIAVKLLVGAPATPTYTRAGALTKRQPSPYTPGDTVWASLQFDGTIALMPFAMAGSGYEIIKDAEEGVHFEFI